MANESRLSITIDSRSAEQQAKDLEKALGALDAAGIRVVSATDRAGKSATGAGRSFSSAGRDAKQGAGGVDSLNRSLEQTDERAATAAATVSRVLKAAFAGFSIMHVIDTADEWGQYASRIKMATQNAEEYDHVQKRMAQSAQITYRSINETRESFIQLSPVLRDMGLSLDDSIDAIDAFSGLLVVNAANGERGAAALAALSKSMQRGKIDSMAWTTILSTMPSIVETIAKSSGLTAVEIRKLGVDGKLSVETLVKALVDGNSDITKQVEGMPTTVRDALQNLNTAFTNYIGWQNEAKGATAALASGVGVLGENFGTIVNLIGVGAAGALAAYVARMGAATLVTVTQAAAVGRAAMGQAALTAGFNGTSAAAARATVAMRTLNAAMGPVGWIGLAASAAAAMYLFSDSSDSARTSAVDLTASVDDLTKAFVASNEAKRTGMLLDMESDLRKAEKAAGDAAQALKGLIEVNAGLSAQVDITGKMESAFVSLKGEIDAISNSAMSAEEKSNALVRAVREMSSVLPKPLADELNRAAAAAGNSSNSVDVLIGKVAALRAAMNAPLPVGGALGSGVTDKLSDEYLKLEGRLNRQIALIGKTGQAAQYRYDLERGELSKMAPLEKARALALVGNLEASEKAEEARRKATGAAGKEAKEIDSLLKSLHDQASVLGMTEQQAARYRIETAKGTDAQKQAALALLDTVQAHEAAERATKLHIEAMRDQRNLAAEIAVFQRQQDLPISGMGLGERRRAQLEAEYAVQEEFARRRRELDEAQRVESTRLDQEVYLDQIEYLREVEEQKIGIIQDSAERRLVAEQNWVTGMNEALNNYVDSAGDVAGQVEDIFDNAFASLETTIFDFVKTGQLDLRGLLTSITDDVLKMLIRMGIQMAANAILGNTLGAASTAASVAMGTATAAAWAPAAAFASLASFGGNSVPAMAGITSTVGLAQGLALTGMAHDGIDSVPQTGTWLLEKGERVTTRDTSARLDSMLSRIESGQKSDQKTGGLTVNLIENPDKAGQVEDRTSDDGDRELTMFVSDIHGAGPRARSLEQAYGLRRMGQ